MESDKIRLDGTSYNRSYIQRVPGSEEYRREVLSDRIKSGVQRGVEDSLATGFRGTECRPNGALGQYYLKNREIYEAGEEGSEQRQKGALLLVFLHAASGRRLELPAGLRVYEVMVEQASRPLEGFEGQAGAYVKWYERARREDPFDPNRQMEAWQHSLYGLMMVQYGRVPLNEVGRVRRGLRLGYGEERGLLDAVVNSVIGEVWERGMEGNAWAAYDSLLDYLGDMPRERCMINNDIELILKEGDRVFSQYGVQNRVRANKRAKGVVAQYLDDLSFMTENALARDIMDIIMHGSRCYPFQAGVHSTEVDIGEGRCITFSMNLEQMLAALYRKNCLEMQKVVARKMFAEHFKRGAKLYAQ